MASSMKSVGYQSSNNSVFMTSSPKPLIRDGEVLIKVSAAGVNRMDLIQVAGKYPPPPGDSEILGVEVSGVICDVSDQAQENSDLRLGDRVMALVGGGGYAEYCVAPYQVVMRIPENVNMTEAAGLPEAFLTAYQAIAFNGRLQDGEVILIHAGASGVGLAAIQLCRQIYKDIKIIATAGSEEKLAVCKQYGADVVVNYKLADFVTEVLSATNDKGADVIIDPVGASYWPKHSQCTAMDGRVLHIGLLGGAVVESVNLGLELRRRVTHNFSTLRTRSLKYKQELISQFLSRAQPSFERGSLKVPLDLVFPLEQVEKAHARVRENRNTGKIILSVD